MRELKHLRLDTGKLRLELGWRPLRTLKDTLREIYRFYETDDGTNTYELCMEHIRQYGADRGKAYGGMDG